MHRLLFARTGPGVGLLAAAFISTSLAAAEPENRFGFAGPEVFPIENLISHLRSGDFDGDGRRDLMVVNNGRSKINLLFNRSGGTNGLEIEVATLEVNELPPDSRFRITSIASEKRISALELADLNSDHRPDLAYFGDPKELVVLFNQGSNSWSAPKRWALNDGLLDMNALASGDLNGDGMEDLLVLGERALHLLLQKPDHTLAEPEKIPYYGSVKAVQILDIDGNGRSDLLLVNWEHANPFRFRLQDGEGHLGPEIHFPLMPIRSYWADDLDGDRKTEVVTIAQKSGRAQISHFVRKPAESLAGSFKQGQFQLLPLDRTTKSRRGTVWADINGDRLADLLVAEPDSGQLTLWLQREDGSLSAARKFPTLTGVTDLKVSDWDDDGVAEIFVLSSDERQVGMTHFDANGRLAFPTLVPVDGRPLSIATGTLREGDKPILAVIVEKDGRREIFVRSAEGQVTRQTLSESFKSNPSSMLVHDADHDGMADLVVLVPYEKIKVLLQTESKAFDEVDIAPPGGSAEQPWANEADIDGDGEPELLLAQRNFLRAVVAQPEAPLDGVEDGTDRSWTFKVKEQINGVSSTSKIVGAGVIHDGENQPPSLFLLDADRKVLTLCQQDEAGVWRVIRNIELPVSSFGSVETVGLGRVAPNAVVFIGLNEVAWMSLTGDVWEFAELDYYETPIKDGYLHDVISGDLNNDGRKDLVFLETRKHYLDLVTFEPPHQLVPANRWQVFEERTFSSRRNDIPEPREAIIADFTGDGLNDLVVLVHDRLLLYPQERE